MRVLLIPSLNILQRKIVPYVPYGLLSLQAIAAQKDGVTVDIAFPSAELLELTFNSSSELVESLLASTELAGYDAYGISTVCNSFYHSLGIGKALKHSFPDSIVFMGGPYATKLARDILVAYDFVDAIFVGESERSFSAFTNRPLDKKEPFVNIKGVYTRTHQFVNETPIQDLDSLPSVLLAKDYLRWLHLTRVRAFGTGASAAPLEASRGCPLQCSFCSTRQVWGSSVRRKSAFKLYSEMNEINATTGDTLFSFIGDNLGAPLHPFMKFCDELCEYNSSYEWGCSLKLDGFEEKHLQRMWNAGCRYVFVGVESSSQETLNRVNKAARVDKEIRMIKIAISMGFKVETSFIIGFPWETLEDIKNTYNLHCELLAKGAHRSQIGVLCPIPGTDIVDGHQISFDGFKSYVAEDDIPIDTDYRLMIERYPNLFSYHGHYPTPNISRVELKAYHNAAGQVSQLYVRNRRQVAVPPLGHSTRVRA